MKAMSKVLSIALTIVLVVGMMPMAVFAQDEAADLTAISIKGKDISKTAADMFATLELAKKNTVEVALSLAQLNDDATVDVAITDGSNVDVKILLVAGGDDSLTDAAAIAGGTGAAAYNSKTVLMPGDVIWISDGDGDNLKYLRVVINQAGGGTIDGGSTVKSPIINVLIPTSLDFAINPLQIGDLTAGSQISTADYRIVNKSEAAVKVSFNITATLETGVTLVEDNSTLKKSDATATAKDVFIAALGAKDVETADPSFSTPGDGDMVYDATEVGTIAPFDPATRKAKIDFVLGGATGSPLDTLAADNKGVTSFQFYGEMNTYAGWKAGDITMSGAYTLQAMRADDYSAGGGTEGIINDLKGLNILPPPNSETPVITTNLANTLTAVTGSEIELSVVVKAISDSGTLSYQWFKNGSAITGKTAATLTIDPAATTDAGTYKVVVTNKKQGYTPASVTSKECVVTVSEEAETPVFDTNLAVSKSVTVGADIELKVEVSASESDSLTYEWFKGNVALTDGGSISGATTDELTITSVGEQDAGSYKVVVTNEYGTKLAATATSAICAVTVTPVANQVAFTKADAGTSKTAPGMTKAAVNSTGLNVYLADRPASLTSVVMNSGTNLVENTGYTYDSATGIVKITQTANGSAFTYAITAGSDVYTVGITLS